MHTTTDEYSVTFFLIVRFASSAYHKQIQQNIQIWDTYNINIKCINIEFIEMRKKILYLFHIDDPDIQVDSLDRRPSLCGSNDSLDQRSVLNSHVHSNQDQNNL